MVDLISFDRANELFSYDPETGLFAWKIDRGDSCKAGSPAGFIHPNGYLMIRTGGRAYTAARLAWLLMTGSWPRVTVDHKNRIRSDNRWSNLRLATRAQQAWNRRFITNTSGHPGVVLHKKSGRWQAQIGGGGSAKYLGLFRTKEEASAAFSRAARARYGEFFSEVTP